MVTGKGLGRWESEDNAAAYDRYARQFPQYREMSQRLVEFAALGGDQVAVDLACGTGMTTEVILARLGQEGRVVAIDGSEAMLDVARRNIRDPRVRFVLSPAEEFADRVDVTADAVISNLAIWQMALDPTFAGARRVLREGGKLVFNIPEAFVDAEASAKRGVSIQSLMFQVAHREFGASSLAGSRRPAALNRAAVETLLKGAGFRVETVETIEVPMSAEDGKAWLSIPVFTEDMLPSLSYEDRLSVVTKAYALADATTLSAWVAVAFVAV